MLFANLWYFPGPAGPLSLARDGHPMESELSGPKRDTPLANSGYTDVTIANCTFEKAAGRNTITNAIRVRLLGCRGLD
jgi:hypothetical protein